MSSCVPTIKSRTGVGASASSCMMGTMYDDHTATSATVTSRKGVSLISRQAAEATTCSQTLVIQLLRYVTLYYVTGGDETFVCLQMGWVHKEKSRGRAHDRTMS